MEVIRLVENVQLWRYDLFLAVLLALRMVDVGSRSWGMWVNDDLNPRL